MTLPGFKVTDRTQDTRRSPGKIDTVLVLSAYADYPSAYDGDLFLIRDPGSLVQETGLTTASATDILIKRTATHASLLGLDNPPDSGHPLIEDTAGYMEDLTQASGFVPTGVVICPDLDNLPNVDQQLRIIQAIAGWCEDNHMLMYINTPRAYTIDQSIQYVRTIKRVMGPLLDRGVLSVWYGYTSGEFGPVPLSVWAAGHTLDINQAEPKFIFTPAGNRAVISPVEPPYQVTTMEGDRLMGEGINYGLDVGPKWLLWGDHTLSGSRRWTLANRIALIVFRRRLGLGLSFTMTADYREVTGEIANIGQQAISDRIIEAFEVVEASEDRFIVRAVPVGAVDHVDIDLMGAK